MTRRRRIIAFPVAIAAIVVLCSMGADGCREPGTVGTYVCTSCHDGRTASDQRGMLDGKHGDLDCEDCHGPGYLHVRNGGRGGLYITNPSKAPFDQSYQLCDTCHEQTVTQFLASKHAENRVVTCFDCHQLHSQDSFRRSPLDNDMCLHCHASLEFGTEEAILFHTAFHPNDPAGTGAGRCAACHLPPLDRAAQADGLHDHTLATIAPIASNEAASAGVTPVPPNSCAGIAGCHDGAVSTVPVFDVDNPAVNEALQGLYELIGQVL